MFNIASYLDKFKNIGLKEVLFKESVAHILEGKIKVTVALKDIAFKNNILTIKTSPLIKNEILIKKSSILKDILEKNPGSIVRDIR